ncbi:MAG: hypothetical protein V4864_22260 [Pseudomonadota bacterium]
MAQLSFGNAYQVYTATTPAAKEQNGLDFIFTALGTTTVDDGNGTYQFNGNDVSVISIVINGSTYYGWISRPVKSGGDVKGFYFWTDPQFTSLAAATADGNQDGDNDDSDNLGFILVVDQAWFDALDWENQGLNLKSAKTSSDKVDDALNALLPPEPPGTPVVVITEDTNNNGVISGSELSGNVDVSIALPGDAVVGDTLVVSDGNTTQNLVLTGGQINAGTVTTSFAPPAQGGTITVTAHVTRDNVSGNSGSDSAVRDTAGPGAPVVTITEDANNNGVLTAGELSGDVDVSIALPGDAVAGDTLTVTDGTTIQTLTLTAQQILDGTVTTTFAAPAPGDGITVTASLTDQNGNQGGPGSDSAVRENGGGPLAVTVVITEDANNNAVISGSELSGDVDVLISLPDNAVAGDTLTVDDGVTTQVFVLTQQQIGDGQVTTTFAPPAQGAGITVSAHVTDQEDNDGPVGTDFAVRDTAGPSAPVVVITEDANDNAVISAPELVGDVDVSIALPGGAVAGDVLSVTDGDTLRTFVLTGLQIAAGSVATSFTPPPQGATITVTAWVTDAQGNDGDSGSDSATRLVAPTPPATPAPDPLPFFPIVLITEDINNNGVIGGNELVGDVNVVIMLPFNTVLGDVLTVTGGGHSWDLALNTGQIAFGEITATFAPPLDGETLTVSAYVTNRAGQQGASGSDSAVRDTSGPAAPRVVITEDTDNNGVLSPGELSGNVDVAVTLGAGAVAGDLLQVTDGTTMQAFTLTAQQAAAGTVTTSFAQPSQGVTMVVYAAVTDSHANRGAIGYDSVGRAPDPVYSVLMANGDRVYTADAHDAALMARGTGNVLEGARFDSLSAAQGGVQMYAFYQPASTDWYFAANGAVASLYGYQQVKGVFMAATTSGIGVGDTYHLYVNEAAITQLVTQSEAAELGLLAAGYQDWGAQFSTTAASAFRFDAEGYLVANKDNAAVQALVHTLAGQFSSSSAAGFIEAVEQDYLGRVQLTGTAHGGAASAADLNAAFGTAFGA